MTDIRTLIFDGESLSPPYFDYQLKTSQLEADDGLATAVILSLFTNRLANDDDVLPNGSDDKRGWWADAYPDIAGDNIGSRLWLLEREKDEQSVVNLAREYAEEALQWMLDDGVASRVDVVAGWVESSGVIVEVKTATVFKGMLAIGVDIHRPDGSTAQFRFDNFWNQL
ncbi:MAG: hypothetical protein GKR93_11880 [Gammaproteobacteria bacterium]|nr:hypothetical protein [Gammaproteobacteria bacterium]